jgi:hypothetical protein
MHAASVKNSKNCVHQSAAYSIRSKLQVVLFFYSKVKFKSLFKNFNQQSKSQQKYDILHIF